MEFDTLPHPVIRLTFRDGEVVTLPPELSMDVLAFSLVTGLAPIDIVNRALAAYDKNKGDTPQQSDTPNGGS